MKEVHEGICGTHIGGWALASKVARAGYCWPTLKRDLSKEIRANLDLLQEAQEVAHVKEFASKGNLTMQHKGLPKKTQKARSCVKKVLTDSTSNKLTPNWEDPHRIVEEVGRGAFRLEHLDGRKVPHTWNMANVSKVKEQNTKRPKRGGRPTIPRHQKTREK
ncbi:hypothetical protein CR513_19888, partial [Mucuna pruriens]